MRWTVQAVFHTFGDSPYPLDRLRIEATAARQWRVVEDMKNISLLAGRLPNVGKLIEYTRKKFDLDRLFGGGDTSDRLGIIQSVAEAPLRENRSPPGSSTQSAA